MSAEGIRFVMIGAGNVAAKYADAIRDIEGAELRGVVAVNQERLADFARQHGIAHAIEVEDMGHAIVEYQSGTQGVIEASTVVQPGYPTRLEFHGEKGSIILSEREILAWDVQGLPQPTMASDAAGSGSKDPMAIGSSGHELIVRDFIHSIREDRDPVVSPASGRLSVQLILAIYESAREARTVQLG